jgi:hypothetical protein
LNSHQYDVTAGAMRASGGYWYCVLRTPWQQVMFNGAVTETVGDLISCAAITHAENLKAFPCR